MPRQTSSRGRDPWSGLDLGGRYGRRVTLPAVDARAGLLARLAAGFAESAGIVLPSDLGLWQLAGEHVTADVSDAVRARAGAGDPGGALGDALEELLNEGERQQGAHYTPEALADRVAELALAGASRAPLVADPACGGGALLLAVARRLAAGGADPAQVAQELLWGADIDPLAAAVTEAAVALWSGGTAPAAGHIVAGDTLRLGAAAWADAPVAGFDAVVGNPPFQGQLSTATARSPRDPELRERFGDLGPYVDTAALFLLVGVELVRPGGRAALVQPLSTVGSRDGGGVRQALTARARLVDLWAPATRVFEARVHVCVPVLLAQPAGSSEASGASGASDWSRQLAAAQGVPSVDLGDRPRIGDAAEVITGFRDQYYALVPQVREAQGVPVAPLVTSGLIDMDRLLWGARPATFAKRRWDRPEVDLGGALAENTRVARWVHRVRRPKVVVASQTRVVEAAADRAGSWLPVPPVVSVVPNLPEHVGRVGAILSAPPVSAWLAQRTAGAALSPGSLRISGPLVASIPVPVDRIGLDRAERAFDDHGQDYPELATAMFRLPAAEHDAVLAWWQARAEPMWPPPAEVR